MSLISLTTSTQETSVKTPFCDQSCQTIRVLSGTIADLCLAVFYKISSLFLFVFTANISHQHNSLSNYYFDRAFSQPFALFTHGSRVIDFSMNTVQRPKGISGENELDALRYAYGSETIDRWCEIGTERIPLNESRLTQLELEDGCCAGISLDFILRYLNECQLGKTSMEAVKTIAPLYATGATEEAEIVQIFCTALDTSNLWDLSRENNQSQWEVSNGLLQQWLQTKNTELSALKQGISQEEYLGKLDVLQTEFRKRLYSLNKELEHRQICDREEILREKLQIITEKLGCSLQLKKVFTTKDRNGEAMGTDFQELVDALPEGAYQVVLCPFYRSSAHSLVFIKTAERSFLQDPNFATFVLTNEEAAQKLWYAGKERYIREGGTMSFRLGTLSLDLATF